MRIGRGTPCYSGNLTGPFIIADGDDFTKRIFIAKIFPGQILGDDNKLGSFNAVFGSPFNHSKLKKEKKLESAPKTLVSE